jgi:hypothetical protein
MVSIPLSKIALVDRWPGVPNPFLGVPVNGVDATEWNFSTMDDTAKTFAPPFPPGTKIRTYTDNSECPGFYTMMYLARHEFSSECISSDISEAVIFCAPVAKTCSTHTAWAGSDGATALAPYFMVQSCYSGQVSELTGTKKSSLMAVPCTTTDADSSITLTTDPYATGYGHAWGWFWVGGVCPVKDISFYRGLADASFLGAEISTDTNDRGALYSCWTGGTFLPSGDPSTSAGGQIDGGDAFGYASACAN